MVLSLAIRRAVRGNQLENPSRPNSFVNSFKGPLGGGSLGQAVPLERGGGPVPPGTGSGPAASAFQRHPGSALQTELLPERILPLAPGTLHDESPANNTDRNGSRNSSAKRVDATPPSSVLGGHRDRTPRLRSAQAWASKQYFAPASTFATTLRAGSPSRYKQQPNRDSHRPSPIRRSTSRRRS